MVFCEETAEMRISNTGNGNGDSTSHWAAGASIHYTRTPAQTVHKVFMSLDPSP